jgi:hypothetical protein
MSHLLLLLVPLVLLPVVLLLAFAGCLGIDPEIGEAEDKAAAADAAAKAAGERADAAEKQIKDDAQKAADDREKKKYENIIGAEANLLCYWRLDEPETGDMTAKDSAPDDPQHGEYKMPQGVSRGESGALALGQNPNDMAAEFLGSGYVEVGYNSVLNPYDSFTIEAWIRPGSAPDPQVVVASYEMGAAGVAAPVAGVVRGFVLDVIPGTTTPMIRARVGDGNGFKSLEASLGDGSEHDGWRHVVLTYFSTKTTTALKLYVNADDGKADAELPSPAAPARVGYARNLAEPFRIGAGQQEMPPASTPASYFHGRIDEVALYGVALDGTRIKAHFLSALTPIGP